MRGNTMDVRTYVLDTSVLLSSPKAIFLFQEHEVVLPIVVIRELESKRHDPELGGMARAAIRAIEKLRTSGKDVDLKEGLIVNQQGGTFRIEMNHNTVKNLPEVLVNDTSNDTRIIKVAYALGQEGKDVVLVSKDLPMRIIASASCGIKAEDFRGDQVPDSGYSGIEEIYTSKELINRLYEDKNISIKDLDGYGSIVSDLPIHTGLVLKTHEGSSHTALAYKGHNGEVSIIKGDLPASGLKPRSAEQRIALSHLLNPEIGIVSLGGPGGTGKSVLALAAALELVMESKTHKKVIVFRPLFAVGGQELGFLPGTEAEKMAPVAAATIDALQAFFSKTVIDEVFARDYIEILPLTYIRGRNFRDSILIVDEAQNLERATILSALSRAGAGTKVFLTHDVAQRDNLHVGRHDGIAAVVEKLKGEELFAHVTLTKSERSPIAALVTRLLDNLDDKD
jgi:PhoH-like ATPase